MPWAQCLQLFVASRHVTNGSFECVFVLWKWMRAGIPAQLYQRIDDSTTTLGSVYTSVHLAADHFPNSLNFLPLDLNPSAEWKGSPHSNAPDGPQNSSGTRPSPTTTCLPLTSAKSMTCANILREFPRAEVDRQVMNLSS